MVASIVRAWLIQRLPEPALRVITKARHGEMAWQARLRLCATAGLGSRMPTAAGYVRMPQHHRSTRAAVVHEFDARDVHQATCEAVSQALDRHGVEHVRVPGPDGVPVRIAVSETDRVSALHAVRVELDGPEWMVDGHGAGVTGVGMSGARRVAAQRATSRFSAHRFSAHRFSAHRFSAHRAAANRGERSRVRGAHLDQRSLGAAATGCGLILYRLLAADPTCVLSGSELACHLEFWRRIDSESEPRADGGDFLIGTHVAPTPNGVVAYFAPESWRAATASPTHWPPQISVRSVFEVSQPIDLVYTWVDGSDPSWLAQKNRYLDHPEEMNESATHGSRFTSHDELRYSLRSAAMYASWCRRIYIVTDAQTPSWLNTAHPKIEVVDHKDIFTDPSSLPVFNSHAIESQLHHINGLSEHYLYLNDDFFFGRPVRPDMFFHGNGVGKFFLSPKNLDIGPPSRLDLPVMSAAKRNRNLLLDDFGVWSAHKFKHTPQPQLRSVLEELEARHPDDFARVAASRFRHPSDLSIPSSLHHYYAYCLGRSVPGSIEYVYQDIRRADLERRLANLARNRDVDVFCLNDNDTSATDLAHSGRILAAFFEKYFPLPSPFEVPGVTSDFTR